MRYSTSTTSAASPSASFYVRAPALAACSTYSTSRTRRDAGRLSPRLTRHRVGDPSVPCRNRIRIGYCIDGFAVGGTELNAVRTLEALDHERFEFTVFHFHKDGALRSRYEAAGVRMVHMPLSRLYAPSTLRQGWRFAQLLGKSGIQVVHTHDLYTNIFAVPWARAAGRRAIASRRWLFDAPRPGLVPLNRWATRLASRVLANSEAVAQVLAGEGIAAQKIARIPNFVGSRAFVRLDEAARSAQRAS